MLEENIRFIPGLGSQLLDPLSQERIAVALAPQTDAAPGGRCDQVDGRLLLCIGDAERTRICPQAVEHFVVEPALGEILPIRLSNDRDTLYLFNVTRIINAVDMHRSKFFELSSGRLGHCLHLIFDPTLIPDDALFFKTTQLGPTNSVFATQAAVNAVKKTRLTGYEFELGWTDD